MIQRLNASTHVIRYEIFYSSNRKLIDLSDSIDFAEQRFCPTGAHTQGASK
jgi:hypothetical protein